MLCGFVNAVIIHRFRIKSIIVTIATLNIFYGILIFVTGGDYIYSLPDWFAAGITWFEFERDQIPYYINFQMLMLVVVFAMTWFLLNRTNIGRQIYAMGGNPDAAQRLGFNLFRLHLIVYGYMGFVAGIASLVQAQLAQSVAPTVLVGKELDVLAAVVLGGASLLGGVGTVLGTILGLTLLAIMQNGLVLLGVSSYWSQFFVGLVILVSVSATAVSTTRSNVVRRARRVSEAACGSRRPAARSCSVGGTNAGLSALLVALIVAVHLDDRRTVLLRVGAALDGLPDAGARHPVARHDDHAALRRAEPLDHRHRQSVRADHGLCADDRFVPGAEGVAWGAWQVAAVAAGFAVAAVIGLINGYVIAYLGVSPILATLGTMTMVKGLSIGLTRGNVISGFPEPIVFIGNGTVLGIPVRDVRLRRAAPCRWR